MYLSENNSPFYRKTGIPDSKSGRALLIYLLLVTVSAKAFFTSPIIMGSFS